MSDLNIRELVSADMPEICEWYVKHKWPVAPGPNILPSLAYIAEVNGKPLAVIWVYLTNSSIFWYEWVATNPDVGLKAFVSLKKLSTALLKIVPETQRIEWLGVKDLVEFAEENKDITREEYGVLLRISKAYVESKSQETPQYSMAHMATPNAKLAKQFEKVGFKNTETAHLLWHNLNKNKGE